MANLYNENESLAITVRQLDSISPTMCYAKWLQVSLHLTNGMTHSCYHPPTHKIDVDEIEHNPSALHNTKEKKESRQQMLDGERPKGCEYCWRIEDVDGTSDRVYRSSEHWAQNGRQDIRRAGADGDVNPRHMEVNFNQACNFKCSYCSPHLSTTWEKEIKEHGAYKIVGGEHNRIESLDRMGLMPLKVKQADNPYVTAFWKWLPEIYPKLEVFRMTGGEPLMDSNTFKMLDYINKHPNPLLELGITTNLCPTKPLLMDKFIDGLCKIEKPRQWKELDELSEKEWHTNHACNNIALFVSVDGHGKQAEYGRSGLNFGVLDRNVQVLLRDTNQTAITFINTFNVLSITSLIKFLQWILDLRTQYSKRKQDTKYVIIDDFDIKKNDNPHFEKGWFHIGPRQRIWFDIPLLRYPKWQCIQMLPQHYTSYLEEAIVFMEENKSDDDNYTGFTDMEIEKLHRNLAFMQEGANLPEAEVLENRANFNKFFTQHDERRDTNFLETFPEMEDWWEVCEQANKEIDDE